MAVKTALLESGPRPFSLQCLPPWGDCLTLQRLLSVEHCEWHLDWNTRTPGRWKADSAWLASTWMFTQGAQAYCSLIGRGTAAWSYIYRPNTCCGHSFILPIRVCAVSPMFRSSAACIFCSWFWLLIIWYLLWQFLVVSTLKAYIRLMIFITLHILKALDLWLAFISDTGNLWAHTPAQLYWVFS